MSFCNTQVFQHKHVVPVVRAADKPCPQPFGKRLGWQNPSIVRWRNCWAGCVHIVTYTCLCMNKSSEAAIHQCVQAGVCEYMYLQSCREMLCKQRRETVCAHVWLVYKCVCVRICDSSSGKKHMYGDDTSCICTCAYTYVPPASPSCDSCLCRRCSNTSPSAPWPSQCT